MAPRPPARRAVDGDRDRPGAGPHPGRPGGALPGPPHPLGAPGAAPMETRARPRAAPGARAGARPRSGRQLPRPRARKGAQVAPGASARSAGAATRACVPPWTGRIRPSLVRARPQVLLRLSGFLFPAAPCTSPPPSSRSRAHDGPIAPGGVGPVLRTTVPDHLWLSGSEPVHLPDHRHPLGPGAQPVRVGKHMAARSPVPVPAVVAVLSSLHPTWDRPDPARRGCRRGIPPAARTQPVTEDVPWIPQPGRP